MTGKYIEYGNISDFESSLRRNLRDLVALQIKKIEDVRRSIDRPSSAPQISSGGRRNVFISYSHADGEWLRRLKVHLRPIEREHIITYWDDTKIKPGSEWIVEIRKAVSEAKVAVLLISADFLASEFVAAEELPRLLAAAEADGARILPLIVSPSRFSRTLGLSRYQAVNSPSKPLIGMTKGESEAVLAKLADFIEDAFTGGTSS